MKNYLIVIIAFAFNGALATADDYAELRQQVADLGKLTLPPEYVAAEGYKANDSIRPIFYDALPADGKHTKVFAWLGLPENSHGKVPAIVLVHGGGGTAFKEWVPLWNQRGFAAISIAVEGQTDKKDKSSPQGVIPTGWDRHPWSGPHRHGIYGDSNKPLKEQWMYHAVADTILANSLIRSLPKVDKNKVGLMGISWGGVITSTVVGIDNRFAFAIPTYGCGHLADTANQYGRSLGGNPIYRKVWDPMLRMDQAKMPILWYSWPGDLHFPLDCQAACYQRAPGRRAVSLVPGMKHGHGAAWHRPESYAFANAIVQQDKPWCEMVDSASDSNGKQTFKFRSSVKMDKAVLVWTTDNGETGKRKWNQTASRLRRDGELWVVTVTPPQNTTSYFVNVQSGKLVASSDYVSHSTTTKSDPLPSASARMQKLFARIDTSMDGELNQDEYVGFFASRFDIADTDGSGKLDISEFKNQNAMKFGDKNKDGLLTPDEHHAVFIKQFDNLDKNKDARITPDEWHF